MFSQLQQRAKNLYGLSDKMEHTIICPIMSIANPLQPCKLSECAWFDSVPNVCCVLSLATAYDAILEFEREKIERLRKMK